MILSTIMYTLAIIWLVGWGITVIGAILGFFIVPYSTIPMLLYAIVRNFFEWPPLVWGMAKSIYQIYFTKVKIPQAKDYKRADEDE